MGTLQKLCVFVCLLACVAATDTVENDDLQHRLALIETTLERVLQKNEQLEKRVASLEIENGALKASVEELSIRVQEIDPAKNDREEMEDGDLVISPRKVPRNKIVTSESVQVKPKRQLNTRTVAFTAVVSPPSLTNLGVGQTIIYDKIITNVGGAYHSTTGVFTAPNSGVYVFNFALMIDPEKNEYLRLVKNGHEIISNFGHGTGASHLSSSSRTTTLELTAGDEVWVRTSTTTYHGTGHIHGNGYTTFSGWIIGFTE